MKQEQVIKIMEAMGYKKYQSGKEVYFLPVMHKIKPMTKVKLEKVMEIFDVKEEKEVKIEKLKVTKKAKKVAKKKEDKE